MRWLACILALMLAVSARGQSTTTNTAIPSGPFRITITGIDGIVQARQNSDQPWSKAAVGQELPEGAEFRTGPRSAVRFTIPPDQTVTLDRLGTVQVLEANFKNGKIFTDLGMKYGRVRYDIEAADREHDGRIRSPATTLAIRGTQVNLTDEPPFAPQAVSLTGRAQFRDARKQLAFGGKGAGKTVTRTDKDTPAALALSQSYVDPAVSYARTATEQRLIEQVISQGGVVSFDPGNPIPIVTGGTPLTVSEILDNRKLPGKLTFALSWIGNVDLNLTIAIPQLNEIVTPIFPLNHSASGGKAVFDHRGGALGGYEIVYWPGNYPGHQPGTQDNKDYVISPDVISGNLNDAEVHVGFVAIDDDGNKIERIDGQPVAGASQPKLAKSVGKSGRISRQSR